MMGRYGTTTPIKGSVPRPGWRSKMELDSRIPQARKRVLRWRLLLDMQRLSVKRHGINPISASIFGAVIIGDAERRPMTAVKIAAYTGLPRTTVLRRLEELRRRGLVRVHHHRTYCVIESKLKVADDDDDLNWLDRRIIATGRELSKTDT